MQKRKTHEETAEWKKRHRENTTLESDTASMTTSTSNETQNRKGKLQFYIVHTAYVAQT